MTDQVLNTFLAGQLSAGLALAAASDRLDLTPIPRGDLPPNRYLARYDCRGLVRTASGEVREANSFTVAVRFGSDHLRRCRPWEIATVIDPPNVQHPNVAGHAICVGHLGPGTQLVEILTQIYEILTFRKITMREDDCLNPAICAWARDNQAMFPTDDRPLRRRRLNLRIETKPSVKPLQDTGGRQEEAKP